MCMTKSPKYTTTAATPIAPAVTQDSPEIVAARDRERRRILSADGAKGTMITGSLGDTSAAPVFQKTLLGA